MGGPAGTDRGVGRASAAPPNPLQDRTFVAASVTEHGVPRPLVAGTRLRLGFTPGRITVEAGCNTLNADVQVGPDRLVVDEFRSTRIACDPEREQQDRMLAEFLACGPAWTLTAAGLTLTSGDVRIDLTEEAGAPESLWGRSFVAIAVTESGTVPAPVVEGTQIVLTFTAPDQLSAHAGCNTMLFQVEVGDTRLSVADDVASTLMGCSAELQAQDEWLVDFLVADPDYTFAVGALTLTRASTEIVLVTQER